MAWHLAHWWRTHQFWLPDAVPDATSSYAVTLPLDSFLEVRAYAARRFWRSLNGRAPGPDFRAMPTQTRRFHILSLRALDALADLPPRFLRTKQAAHFLGISLRTLEKHRTYGTGPLYRKIGGRVVYAIRDLEAWTEIGARKSPKDRQAGTVFPARPPTPEEQERL